MKKKLLKLLAAISAVSIISGITALPVFATEPEIVNTVTITGVTAPVVNALPDFDWSIPEDANYAKYYDNDNDTCAWIETDFIPTSESDLDEGEFYYQNYGETLVFKADKYYTFSAWIINVPGYEIDDNFSATINGNTAKTIINEYNGPYVWYTFPKTTVTDVDTVTITDVVEPVVDEEVDFTWTIPENANYAKYTADYSDTCNWVETDSKPTNYEDLYDGTWCYPSDDEPLVFEAGKYYTFIAWLDNVPGYNVVDDVNATINGNEANVYTYDYEAPDIWYTFPPVAEKEKVEAVAVSGVTEPIANQTASYDWTVPADKGYGKTTEYEPDCFWVETDTTPASYDEIKDIILDGDYYSEDDAEPLVFKAGKYYTFVAYVDADKSHEFSTDAIGTLNGKEANLYVYPDYTVEADLYKTFGPLEEPVPEISVTPKTADVVKGNSKQFSANVKNFDGDVVWTVSGANSKYTTISSTGTLTVDVNETAVKLTVKAEINDEIFDTAIVTVRKTTSGGSDSGSTSPNTGDSSMGIMIVLITALSIAAFGVTKKFIFAK